jgi:hypothetical protein
MVRKTPDGGGTSRFSGEFRGRKSKDGPVCLTQRPKKNKRGNPNSVFDEVASKARDTLAGLAVARAMAQKPQERTLAQQALGYKQIRVALQLAQSARHHRLFQHVVEPADAHMLLRKAVKQIDRKPICAVGSLGQQNKALPWCTVAI